MVPEDNTVRLIDQFVTNTPNFEFNPRDLPQNDDQEDLTEKNCFSGLATENYAEIMVRQGKVEQAIEIYRKLIWKNPQKKTYFAKKIEALKKG
jgi:tetratricopeptide (TPR) repeat protein